MSGTQGEVDFAVRRALNIFDEWNDVTGHTTRFSSDYHELQAVIEDAVHCGFQQALNDRKPLPNAEESND